MPKETAVIEHREEQCQSGVVQNGGDQAPNGSATSKTEPNHGRSDGEQERDVARYDEHTAIKHCTWQNDQVAPVLSTSAAGQRRPGWALEGIHGPNCNSREKWKRSTAHQLQRSTRNIAPKAGFQRIEIAGDASHSELPDQTWAGSPRNGDSWR